MPSQWFSILAVHWSHRGSFNSHRCLGTILRDSDVASLGCHQGHHDFSSSAGDFNGKPSLRTLTSIFWFIMEIERASSEKPGAMEDESVEAGLELT